MADGEEEWTAEEALLDAARYGDVDDVKSILECMDPVVNVDATDASGNTALHKGGNGCVGFLPLLVCGLDVPFAVLRVL
jgi:hypothetical protein